MKLNKHSIILILILVLSLLLRGYRLDSFPPLNPDEAAIGYNAYSLLQTGHDEHGNPWPIHFKSFGDYKPGGYFYLVLPFVKLLGLNQLAVRIPNLILSILAILFLYKLVLLLTLDFRLSLLSSFLLAITPWHIHFSRGGWESSTALSFIIIGLYFFFKYIKKQLILDFTLFIIFFVLSLYTYHSARIIAPLLALSLFYIHKSYLLNHKSKLIVPLLLGIIITLPVAFSFLHGGGATRFGGVGLTADQGPLWRSNELLNQHSRLNLPIRIIHNKRLLYMISWAEKYLSHFDPNYLFVTGDDVPRSKVPDMGQIYLLGLPFIIIGIYFLLKSPHHDLKYLTFSFLLIAPVASSLTFQAPSALRSLPLVIPLTIFTAYGLNIFINWILKIGHWSLFGILGLLVIGYLFSLSYYLDAYFIHYPQRLPSAWSYGFDQVTTLINSQKTKYANIYVTDRYDQPYIMYLFYSQFPPTQIQPQIKLSPPDQFGFSTVRQIDNIHFAPINWDNIAPHSLVIAADEPVSSIPIQTINFPNGSPAFKIYTK